MCGKDKDTLVEGLPFDDDDGLPFDLDQDAPTQQSASAADDGWAAEWEEDDITNVGAMGPATPVGTALDVATIDPTPGTVNAYLMHLIQDGEDIAHIIAPNMIMVRLGRGRQNEIQLASDGEISRRHCLIMRQRDEFFIEDLGSTNGTVVNGEPVRVARLEPNAEIALGESRFRFVFMQKSAVATARTIHAG
jgi:hypothetical protein